MTTEFSPDLLAVFSSILSGLHSSDSNESIEFTAHSRRGGYGLREIRDVNLAMIDKYVEERDEKRLLENLLEALTSMISEAEQCKLRKGPFDGFCLKVEDSWTDSLYVKIDKSTIAEYRRNEVTNLLEFEGYRISDARHMPDLYPESYPDIHDPWRH